MIKSKKSSVKKSKNNDIKNKILEEEIKYNKQIKLLKPHCDFVRRYITTLNKSIKERKTEILNTDEENIHNIYEIQKKIKVFTDVKKYLMILRALCGDIPDKPELPFRPVYSLRLLDIVHKTLEAVYKRQSQVNQ